MNQQNSTQEVYVDVNQLFVVDKTFSAHPDRKDEHSCQVSVGEGSNAVKYKVGNEVVASILASSGPLTKLEWCKYFERVLELNENESEELVGSLIDSRILGDVSRSLTPSERKWLELDWSDALHEYWNERNMIWKHDYSNNPKVMTISGGKNVLPSTPPPGPAFAVPIEGANTIMLPDPAPLDASFADAVRRRRTSYNFEHSSISLEDLSAILQSTLKGKWTDGVAPLRVSQSYSRGEPFIAYVFAGKNSSAPLEPGTCYQYDAVAGNLVPISKSDFTKYSSFLWGQNYGDEAPICIILAAHWMHFMWKYRSPRAYRWVFTECGSFMQTLLATATALGYRTWQTPALDDAEMAVILNQHPKDIEAIYMVAIGARESQK